MNEILKNFKLLGRVKELKSSRFVWPKDLDGRGVYLIVYEGKETPQFIVPGCGPEKYKDRKVNVLEGELKKNWLDLDFDRIIIYIGKSEGENGVGARLKMHMRFGSGEDVNAYGGRYIWQIKDSDNLLVFWKKSDNPEGERFEMLKQFKEKHTKLPFANLRS